MTLAFLGTGSMGSALLAGILSGGVDPAEVVATAASRDSAAALHAGLGIRTLSLEDDEGANRIAVAEAKYVFLGVKPWMMRDALADIAESLAPEAVLVSMAAGVSLQQLAAASGTDRVIRIMPNTPAAIGFGVIAVAGGEAVPEAAVHEVAELLAGAGDVVEMAEDDIHAMTGLAGSGAAYFYLLAEALVAAGVEQGLSPEVATRLVVGTANGSGRMLSRNPQPAALREAVTSKGGTTAAALASFENDGFREIVTRAAAAATARSKEMEAGG